MSRGTEKSERTKGLSKILQYLHGKSEIVEPDGAKKINIPMKQRAITTEYMTPRPSLR